MRAKSREQGFTLIELVVVIVILGILAATALPKFIDMSGDAKLSGVAGVAGGVSSASAVNYAGKAAGHTVTPATNSAAAATICTSANLGAMLTSGWPNGYTVDATGSTGSCSTTGSVTCAVFYGANNATYSTVAGVTCY